MMSALNCPAELKMGRERPRNAERKRQKEERNGKKKRDRSRDKEKEGKRDGRTDREITAACRIQETAHSIVPLS